VSGEGHMSVAMVPHPQAAPPGKSKAAKWAEDVAAIAATQPPDYSPPPGTPQPIFVSADVAPNGTMHLRIRMGGTLGIVDVEVPATEAVAQATWALQTFGVPAVLLDPQPLSISVTAVGTLAPG
jgi:hypothetical protein